MKLLSIVVPVYNEIVCLPLFYERACKLGDELKRRFGELELEFVFIDDGSKDDSFKWLSDLVKRDSRVHVLKLSRNFGSYVALTAGLVHAKGDAAVILSADLQDPPELIPDMVEQWKKGFDVVWAERRSRGSDPLWKRVSAGAFYALFRKIAFAHYPPKGYDFCLVDRAVIESVAKSEERNTSIFALIVWAAFESTSVPYDRGERAGGVSKWNFRKMMRLATDSIVSFSVVPVRLALWCAVLIGLGLFGYMAFIVYGKVTGAYQFPEGWPSTMTMILLTSGLQLFVLAVLGEYLWRALDQTRGRPLYVISRRLGYKDDASRTR